LLLSDRAPSCTSPLSLHDALPISLALRRSCGDRAQGVCNGGLCQARRTSPSRRCRSCASRFVLATGSCAALFLASAAGAALHGVDRKSTRLNSSHVKISYAVFCLK